MLRMGEVEIKEFFHVREITAKYCWIAGADEKLRFLKKAAAVEATHLLMTALVSPLILAFR